MMLDNINGFPSRYDAFPAGLRVLVVDDDPTWLKILEKMLKKCSYEVTTCGLAREALSLLRERKDGFDIVISDVNMPDMDGFKLLEHVGLEMDLPVIMMSVDGETSRVMKGVQHGACDYLLKPIRMKELRNIWQHVFRKRIHEVRDIESLESIEGIRIVRNGCDQSDDGHSFSGEDWISMRKRKDNSNKYDDKDFGDPSATKKARVVWTVDLHQKFVDAVNQIGLDKVGPKKILDLMNVPWLTRENVASHLQKYRLYLSRLHKENDEKNSAGGLKHSDTVLKEPDGSFTQQKPVEMVTSQVTNGHIHYSGNNLNVSDMNPQIQDSNLEPAVSMPELKSLAGNNPDPQALLGTIPEPGQGSGPPSGFHNSFVPLESQLNYSFDSNMPTRFTWNDVSTVQFDPDSKPLLQLDNSFDMLPLTSQQHHIQPEILQSTSSISARTSTTEKDLQDPVITLPSYAESVAGNFPIQSSTHMDNYGTLNPVSAASSSMENQGYLCSVTGLVSEPRALVSESGSPVASPDDDNKLCWFPYDHYTTNLGVGNPELLQIADPGFVTETPFNIYDALKTEYDYLYDLPVFSPRSQGLFEERTYC